MLAASVPLLLSLLFSVVFAVHSSSPNLLVHDSPLAPFTPLSHVPRSKFSGPPIPGPSVQPNTQTSDDISTITQRRSTLIIATAANVSSISSWLSSLGPNGQWPPSEIDYTSGCSAQRANWPAEVHWDRILTMSAAFHGGLDGADQFANDQTLRGAITSAMDFWFSNDFTNVACLDSGGKDVCPCGTPGFWNTNWFSNIIAIPKLVVQSCLLLSGSLQQQEQTGCANIASRSYATFGRQINDLGTLTGANTLDVASVGIDLGLLTVNSSLLSDAYGRVHSEVVIQQAVKADGIRPDGSFGQHGGIIYNGNYGKDYANDYLALEISSGGTQFEAPETSKDAFTTLIDADQWMIFRNTLTGVLHWDFSVLGRFISFPVADQQATGSININITQFDQLGQEWPSQPLIQAFTNLNMDTPSANAGNLSGNRMFYANDYMSHRGNGYVTTVRMYSNRTQNSECLNSQNPFGFHLSDGTVYTYLAGNEYEDIAAAWDWNLIPGTTVDYNATPLTCDGVQFTGVESFVGGASTGSVGVAVMRYTNPSTRSLSWQKSWFFFDEDVQHVMINSISSQTQANVFSVLDQRVHTGSIFVDGQEQQQSGNFTDATMLWHGGVGYSFQKNQAPGTQLSIDFGDRVGNWATLGISTQPPPTVDLFAAWLSHTNVSAPTSYTAFPATSNNDEFVSKAKSKPIQDLQNDKDVSAALDPSGNVAMIVFWQPQGGSLTIPGANGAASMTVQSDRGLAVIVQLETLNVTFADPSQLPGNATLTFTLSAGTKPKGWGDGMQQRIDMLIPSKGSASFSLSTTGSGNGTSGGGPLSPSSALRVYGTASIAFGLLLPLSYQIFECCSSLL